MTFFHSHFFRKGSSIEIWNSSLSVVISMAEFSPQLTTDGLHYVPGIVRNVGTSHLSDKYAVGMVCTQIHIVVVTVLSTAYWVL